MKPINHHFSGPTSIGDTKKWFCTLAYNADNKRIGISVVGTKDQFCRKTGARIALGRTMNPDLTAGQFCYKVKSDEELKEILSKFRAAKYRQSLLALLGQYFPNFKTYKVVNRPISKKGMEPPFRIANG